MRNDLKMVNSKCRNMQ